MAHASCKAFGGLVSLPHAGAAVWVVLIAALRGVNMFVPAAAGGDALAAVRALMPSSSNGHHGRSNHEMAEHHDGVAGTRLTP